MKMKEFRNSATAGTQPAPTTMLNGKNFPRFFYARHMQPGLVGYENETVLVDADAIKKMLPSLNGKPMYVNHRDVALDTLKQDAAGYVTDSFWNELDGWAWSKIMLVDDEAVDLAHQGWSVSNAYIPEDWAGGGLCNNMGYDRAITTGTFTHMALVKDPRYEGAKIFTPEDFKKYQDEKRQQLETLNNSKTEPKKASKMKLSFFKTERKEVSDVDADTSVELSNGKTVTVAEMVQALESAEKQNAKPQTVLVNGKEVPVTEMVAAYEAMQNAKGGKTKKNEADMEGTDSTKENAAEDDKEKANSEDADKEKENSAAEDDQKENSKPDHFKELSNAHNRAEAVTTIDTPMSQLNRGQQRYGSGR